MFRDLDARLSGEGECKNFARSDVPRIVRLGKFRHGESVVGQADGCLGPCSTEWRTSAKEKAQVLGGFRLTMNCIGGAQKGVEANQGREFPAGGGEKRAVGVKPETQRTDARRIVKRQHVVNVPIRLLGQDFLADGALDQNAPPAIRAAVVNCPEERPAMMSAALQWKRCGVDGERIGALEPFERILKRDG